MLILKQENTNLKKECIHFLSHPGSVLILPTETVYGLVCNWGDKKAYQRIFNMKGRDVLKPLQMLAPDIDSVEGEGGIITNDIKKVVNAFCPGPITIIANKTDKQHTVGFRIPDYAPMLDLLLSYGANLAATSANFADSSPATTIDEAISSINGEPDLVVDAGTIKGEASTVVDMTGPYFKILRKGPITKSEISEILL